MKKISILIIFIIILLTSICIGSSVTYYDGNSILLENTENIEILSNEVIIDATNSNISNTILLKNTGNSKIKTKVNIKLEDEILSTKIHDLSIKTNGANIQYEKSENGIYLFDIEIPKNEGKKIEIHYVTDNNLADAKVIKYSLNNLQIGDKKIGKVKVDIKLNEIDIPLTKGIYPGHYTVDFETNTVSVEYYNFKVNNLTRDIILEKDTLQDILRNSEELEKADRNIAESIENWIEKGIEIDYSKIEYIYNDNVYKELFNPQDYKEEYWYLSTPYEELFTYYLNKQLIKDNKYEFIQDNYFSDSISPLLSENIKMLVKKYSLDEETPYITKLYGKIICIGYELLDLDKDLYVHLNHNFEYYNEEYDTYFCDSYIKIVNRSQEEILKTPEYSNGLFFNAGERRVFVGVGINGEFIDATLQEKIEYVNMINADMFIIQKLYDKELGEVNSYINHLEDGSEIEIKYYNPPYVGYYGKENEEMVIEFYTLHYDIISEEDFYDRDWLIQQYSTYENYVIEENKTREEEYIKSVIRIEESELDLAEIPTFILYRGYIYENDGKNFVDFLQIYNSYGTGISTTNQVLDTKRAQELITANREKNSNVKKSVEQEITNLVLTPDKEENDNNILNTDNQIINNRTQHIIVMSIISLGIIICTVILVIKGIRNNKKIGGDNNGEQE